MAQRLRWHMPVLMGAVWALLLFGVAQPAVGQKAADFYVATSGDDNWSGALDAANASRTDGPFATLERARRAVQGLKKSRRNAPIVVMVRQGVYLLSEPLRLGSGDSGSPNAPVIYQSYPGEKPVVSGGKPVTGWKVSGGRWTVSLDPDNYKFFEQLFVNDQRRYRPRLPREGYFHNEGPVFVDSASEKCRQFSQKDGGFECFDRFRFKRGDLQGDYANINNVEIDDFEKWTMSKMRLASVDTSQGIAYLTGTTFQNVENSGFIRGHRFLVENVKEALGEPGEWYLDRSSRPWQLTYIPRPGESPDKDMVMVPQLARLIAADNLSYVTFKGLTFAHDNWVVPPEGHGSLQSEPAIPAALSFRRSNNIILDGCTIAHTGAWGVEFVSSEGEPSHHNQVVNSVLWDLGTGGIRVGDYYRQGDTEDSVPHDNLFQNNLITAGGRILPAGIGTGIWIGNSPNNTITHNEIYDFYGGGIGVCTPTPRGCPFPHDNTVSFNHVYKQGQGVISDFGGIYVAAYKTTGNKVLNNWVHDVTHNFQEHDGYGGHGIYLDNITSNVLVQNNLVYRESQTVLFNNGGANNTWTNNIFAYGRGGIIQIGGMEMWRRRNQQRQGGGNQGQFGGGPFGRNNGPFGRQGRQRPRNVPEGGGQQGERQQADPDKPVVFFTHNIVIWDRSDIQRTPGFWVCQHPISEEKVPCSERFLFDYNLYWNPEGKAPNFATADADNPRDTHWHSFGDWRKLGEDEHSINENPGFADPRYPADNFTLQSNSAVVKIGFVPFDPKQAGLSTPLPRPPSQPPAFPLEVLDPGEY